MIRGNDVYSRVRWVMLLVFLSASIVTGKVQADFQQELRFAALIAKRSGQFVFRHDDLICLPQTAGSLLNMGSGFAGIRRKAGTRVRSGLGGDTRP